jgi:hypothetical protein
MDGDLTIVAGSVKTQTMEATGKVLPDALKAEQHRTMAEPGSGT